MGVAGADAMCVDRARAANLPGTYRAWVSSQTENAKDRLGGARGWIRTDGRPFADRIEDALVGNFFFPPRLDETGADLGFVWIQNATQASGIYDSNNGWTSSAPSGVKTSSTESFDRFFTDGLGCAVSLPVFCLRE